MILEPLDNEQSLVQRNFDAITAAVNALGMGVGSGSGVPTYTPPAGRGLYIDLAGGAGSTLYVYEGAGWVAK